MTLQDHLLAAIDETPKCHAEIAAEISRYIGREIKGSSLSQSLYRAMEGKAAIRLPCGGYVEPFDNFRESTFGTNRGRA